MTRPLVHIVDDDPAVRDSLSMLLESADLTPAAYPDAERFLADAALDAPGCVIADVRMPGMSGLDLLRLLNQRRLDLPLIIISGHADVAMAVEALKEGAADFIEKPFDDETFLRSTREALDRGERSFRQRCRRDEIETRFRTLTPREGEVMDRVVRGMPNKAVAADLTISVRTVEIHRARVMEKMDADSLSALVRMALALEVSPEVQPD
ncbi:response regulator transcription factor [Magnetospirillum molischianum]|uniref:Two component response transcriptional regulatory protein, LuxR family n=1 Tax=Magnetospirillum molischianum DSM 120 TaxID=1150626 RepID=H8FRN5_MAGML|nr:response regulator [Magnetospirillum molischianum]CCG41023.1 Two component response transcriptional regulatory protein, LuxR family [Magnetospirillum molischianum DSM 120]